MPYIVEGRDAPFTTRSMRLQRSVFDFGSFGDPQAVNGHTYTSEPSTGLYVVDWPVGSPLPLITGSSFQASVLKGQYSTANTPPQAPDGWRYEYSKSGVLKVANQVPAFGSPQNASGWVPYPIITDPNALLAALGAPPAGYPDPDYDDPLDPNLPPVKNQTRYGGNNQAFNWIAWRRDWVWGTGHHLGSMQGNDSNSFLPTLLMSPTEQNWFYQDHQHTAKTTGQTLAPVETAIELSVAAIAAAGVISTVAGAGAVTAAGGSGAGGGAAGGGAADVGADVGAGSVADTAATTTSVGASTVGAGAGGGGLLAAGGTAALGAATKLAPGLLTSLLGQKVSTAAPPSTTQRSPFGSLGLGNISPTVLIAGGFGLLALVLLLSRRD